MNSEILSQKLSPKQKRILGEVWVEMVTDSEKAPNNIGEMNTNEIKRYLFKSVMEDIERFVEKLGLRIDAKLVESIKTIGDLEEKSALELEYIKQVHAQVDKIVQRFNRSRDRSTKWDSWPKRMRETKEFNCVGAALIGICLLEKGGIKSYYGKPYGHVVNIARLSNGDWWYVDFRNGKQNVVKLRPEETMIAGMPVLKIDQLSLPYKIIPLFDNPEAAGSILGNLSELKREAEDENKSDKDIDKREAKEYLKKYEQNFEKVNFSLLHHLLYPRSSEIMKTNEMQKEEARIDSMRDSEKSVQEYIKTLTGRQKEALIKEIKAKKKDIEDLFLKKNDSVLQEISLELKRVLMLYLESLRHLREKQPEMYQEILNKIVDRIRSV